MLLPCIRRIHRCPSLHIGPSNDENVSISWYLMGNHGVDCIHNSDVIISAMASQITGVSVVCLTVCSGSDQRKKSKLRVTGLCEGNPPVTGGFSPHKGPVMQKMFPFDDVIMRTRKFLSMRKNLSNLCQLSLEKYSKNACLRFAKSDHNKGSCVC